jgi:hypothetical protein
MIPHSRAVYSFLCLLVFIDGYEGEKRNLSSTTVGREIQATATTATTCQVARTVHFEMFSPDSMTGKKIENPYPQTRSSAAQVNYANADEILTPQPANHREAATGRHEYGARVSTRSRARELDGEPTDLSGGGGASASRSRKGAGGVEDAVAARRTGRSGCHIAQESRRHAAAAAAAPLFFFPPSVVSAAERSPW